MACLAYTVPDVVMSGIAMFLHFLPSFSHALLAEGLMICLVCPTAGAAAVITGKLGGSETSLTTYTILSNMAAAIIIPLVFPMVENHTETSFLCQFLTILRRVFPLLIFPFLIAWGLRVFFPKAHAAVVRHTGGLAFYLWGVRPNAVCGTDMPLFGRQPG